MPVDCKIQNGSGVPGHWPEHGCRQDIRDRSCLLPGVQLYHVLCRGRGSGRVLRSLLWYFTPDIMHTSKTVEVLAVAYIGAGAACGAGRGGVPLHLCHGNRPIHPVPSARTEPGDLRPGFDPGDDLLPRGICASVQHLVQTAEQPDDQVSGTRENRKFMKTCVSRFFH